MKRIIRIKLAVTQPDQIIMYPYLGSYESLQRQKDRANTFKKQKWQNNE